MYIPTTETDNRNHAVVATVDCAELRIMHGHCPSPSLLIRVSYVCSLKNVIIQVKSECNIDCRAQSPLFIILLKYLIKMFPPLDAPHTGAAALQMLLLHCRG